MKVFVYSKKTSKTIAVIKDVARVEESSNQTVTFITNSGEKFSFDTKQMKTTTYQN